MMFDQVILLKLGRYKDNYSMVEGLDTSDRSGFFNRSAVGWVVFDTIHAHAPRFAGFAQYERFDPLGFYSSK